MRLLRTKDLTYREFFDDELPTYCILSHRWHGIEITYQDMIGNNIDSRSDSFRKIIGSCNIARDLQCEWIWIDTCCINKSSSAELSEAINSMFDWYASAEVCIAYLNDVHLQATVNVGDPALFVEAFRWSKWFTRGWTLQELLAPSNLRFYDKEYTFLGTKSDLSQEIRSVTGIDTDYLLGRKSIYEACVAERMSWTSKRKTTRVEDQAYCLLGIFNVNMPLIYGERKEAFFRLQLAIMAKSDDETLFAWLPHPQAKESDEFGMLARSPRDFSSSAQVRKFDIGAGRRPRPPYTFTNKGVELRRSGGPPRGKDYQFLWGSQEEAIVGLACKNLAGSQYHQTGFVAVILRRTGESWYRVRSDRFQYVTKPDASSFAGLIPAHRFYIIQPDTRRGHVRTSHTVDASPPLLSPSVANNVSAHLRHNLRGLFGFVVVVAFNTIPTIPTTGLQGEAKWQKALELVNLFLYECCKEYATWLVWKQVQESWDLSLAIDFTMKRIGIAKIVLCVTPMVVNIGWSYLGIASLVIGLVHLTTLVQVLE